MTQALYGSLQDHATALLDLLYAQDDLITFPAPDGGPTVVPAGTAPPFVTVAFVGDHPLGGRLDHRSSRFRMRAYARCVGADGIAARAVADLVREAWLDVKPDVAGRSCFPIRSEAGDTDPRSDQSTGLQVVTIATVYRLESLPGRTGS